jgi:D-alanyl-D-alanine carboxypeptidase
LYRDQFVRYAYKYVEQSVVDLILAFTIDASGEENGAAAPPVPWWSFTKTVIAVACFRAAEAGQLDLQAAAWPGGCSLLDLLRHEGGLPDYGAWPEYHAAVAARHTPWPAAAVIQRGLTTAGPPGPWAYSNIGYALVTSLITDRFRLPLSEVLKTWVLAPARATSPRLAITAADLAGVVGVDPGYDPNWVYHGLLVGELRDAARIARALAAGELLGASFARELLRPTFLPNFGTAAQPDPAYGAGVMLPGLPSGLRLIGHTGSGPTSDIAVYAQSTPAGVVAVAAFSDEGSDVEGHVRNRLGSDAQV